MELPESLEERRETDDRCQTDHDKEGSMMQDAIRPNVRGWRQHGMVLDVTGAKSIGKASARRIDRVAWWCTALVVSLVTGLVLWLPTLSAFWAGIVLGGLATALVLIGLLALGACVGGARLSRHQP
jgi:hypothetical protein